MSDEKRKGFVMYRSFINAIRTMPADNFKECVLALSDYAYEGIEYAGNNPVVIMYMELVKPQVDANNSRYENGKKGGRPPKPKQEEEETADVEAIPLNDGTEWKPTISKYTEYCRLYPNVDVAQAFRSMRGWSIENPTKRKTAKGVGRFVNSWLEREQNKGRQYSKFQQPTIKVEMPEYIKDQIDGSHKKGKAASAETLAAVKKMQEEMKDA